MPDPGQQQSVTLPEMLRRIAKQKATGVLQVRGQEGWKVLELQAGSITIVTGDPGKRVRLGEVLLARGKITRDILAKALDVARESGAALGDVLAQQGYITPAEIQDIVRFQVDEEIYDLFTWKGAECTFAPGSTIADQMGDYPDAANLAVDPQRVFVEAARRIPIWSKIEKSVYSAFVIFRLTERGEAMLTTATREGRKLLELIRQGYSLDTIVRRTMVGRFTIWKAASDLVAAQAVQATPDAELEDLAAQWEVEGKVEQAWGAYRRLAEIPANSATAAELLNHAEGLWQDMRAREQHGLVRARAAAAAAPAGSRTTIILLAVLATLVMAAVFWPAIKIVIRPPEKTEDFMKAQIKAQALEEQARLADALDIWERFLVRYPESILAQSAQELVKEKYEQVVSNEIARARSFEEQKQFGEAIALYEDTLRRYPRTSKHERISTLRGEADRAWEEWRRKLSRDELGQELARAKTSLEGKKYSAARSALQTIVSSQEAGTELRNEARGLLKDVREVEAKAKKLLQAAKAKESKPDNDSALTIYRECYDLWPDSSWGRTAAERLTLLGREGVRAKRLYEEGVRRYHEGEFTGAHGRLKEAARFNGFSWGALAAEKLRDMAGERERSSELLDRAQRLTELGKLDEAFEALRELAKRFPHTLAAKKLKLMISIETVPAGAQVTLNRERLGLAPRTAILSPGDKVDLVLRKRGFVEERRRYESALAVPGRVLRFHLQKKMAFRQVLGKPVLSSPAVYERQGSPRAAARFFVHAGARLTGFRSDRGEELWRAEIKPARQARIHPAVLDDIVYAMDGDRLRAFSVSGGERFDIAVGSLAATSPVALRLRLAANRGFVILACEDGSVISLDLVTRARRWAVRLKPPIRVDLIANEESVLVASPGGTVTSLDILSGRTRWKRTVSGEVAGDLALDEEGKLLGVLTSLGELVVFSAADGTVRMRAPLDGVHGGGVAIASGAAFVGGDDGRLRAIDIATASPQWKVSLDGAVRDEPVASGSLLYAGTQNGKFYCVDAASGREEWHLDAQSPITASVAVSAGMLIFGTQDGELFGIEAETAHR